MPRSDTPSALPTAVRIAIPVARRRSKRLESRFEALPRPVADLRITVTRRSTDGAATGLVQRLGAASPEFAGIWALHEVARRQSTRKVLEHPVVGTLDCQCDVVVSPPSGQRLVLFRGTPGTDAAARLELLRVIGSQDLAAAP